MYYHITHTKNIDSIKRQGLIGEKVYLTNLCNIDFLNLLATYLSLEDYALFEVEERPLSPDIYNEYTSPFSGFYKGNVRNVNYLTTIKRSTVNNGKTIKNISDSVNLPKLVKSAKRLLPYFNLSGKQCLELMTRTENIDSLDDHFARELHIFGITPKIYKAIYQNNSTSKRFLKKFKRGNKIMLKHYIGMEKFSTN